MLRHIAAFEWRYQVKSPVFWVGFALFFLLTFGSVTSDNVQIGAQGNVNINSPYAILQTQGVLSLFLIFVIVAMVAGVILRDDDTGFGPILRSTSMSRSDYLVGRFIGAIAATFAVLACIPLAIAIGSLMPWLDSEKVGPFQLSHYLYALFAFGLPTLLIIGATCFAFATATRSLMWTYVAMLAMIVLYLVARGLLSDPAYQSVAALADPFGRSALDITTRYWTAAERNTQLPPMTGLLLANRLIWFALALLLFAVTAWRFRFDSHRGLSLRRRPKTAAAPAATDTAAMAAAARGGPLPSPRADAATRWAQLVRLARFDMAFVFRSPAFFVLLAIGMLNAGAITWLTGEIYGSPSFPVTRLMVQALIGQPTRPDAHADHRRVCTAGELVWRDHEQPHPRDRRCDFGAELDAPRAQAAGGRRSCWP